MAVTFPLLTVASNSSKPAAIKINQEMLIAIFKAGDERNGSVSADQDAYGEQ